MSTIVEDVGSRMYAPKAGEQAVSSPLTPRHPLDLAEAFDAAKKAPVSTPSAVLAVAPATAPAAPIKPRTADELASDLYHKEVKIEVPSEVEQWRDKHQSPAERFYTQPIGEIEAAVRGMDDPTLDQPTREAVARELTQIARDVGLESPEAMNEFSGAVAEASTLDQASRASLRETAANALRAEFGERAGEALAAARALACRDPRTAKILDQTGAGDHPKVILRFAREGLKQRAAGKLNK